MLVVAAVEVVVVMLSRGVFGHHHWRSNDQMFHQNITSFKTEADFFQYYYL